jgi:DNA polymerase-1
MIEFDNKGRLVQCQADLPAIPNNIDRLFADVETTSGDPRQKSTNPWKHCGLIGTAFTWDKEEHAYFIPKEILQSCDWLERVLSVTESWANHNIKYDCHVIANTYGEKVLAQIQRLRLICTLTLAKMLDSERLYKGGYGLEVLCEQWLGRDIMPFYNAIQPYLKGNKDYGVIPLPLLAEYACEDVIANRDLLNYIIRKLPKSCYGVKDIEIETTKTLLNIERRGFYIDFMELARAALAGKEQMLEIIQGFNEEFERPIEPHVPKDVELILLGLYKLPVLGRTKKGAPSFGQKTLKKYLTLPDAPRPFIEKALKYKKRHAFVTKFAVPVLNFANDGIVRAMYNQMVRTGRLSCTDPNAQAFELLAKGLIHPREGNAYIVADYSQVEYRDMAHYAKEKKIIDAYNENPDIDFHEWTAKEAGITRKLAKTLNFACGMGQGEKSTIEVMSSDEFVQKQVKAMEGNYLENLTTYVRGVRSGYYERFPSILPTIRSLANQTKNIGYCENIYGRRRHLMDYNRGMDESRKTFSTLCQGTAADLMKERMNALERELPKELELIATVHDEVAIEGPIEMIEDPETHKLVARIMESPDVPIAVPYRISLGTSRTSWLEAKREEKDGGNAKAIHWK